jgi:hypothetical protein
VPDRLAQACAQFEALVLRQMLTDSGISRSATLGDESSSDDTEADTTIGRSGADVVQSMFVETLAQTVADADRTGLGHMLEISLRGVQK